MAFSAWRAALRSPFATALATLVARTCAVASSSARFASPKRPISRALLTAKAIITAAPTEATISSASFALMEREGLIERNSLPIRAFPHCSHGSTKERFNPSRAISGP